MFLKHYRKCYRTRFNEQYDDDQRPNKSCHHKQQVLFLSILKCFPTMYTIPYKRHCFHLFSLQSIRKRIMFQLTFYYMPFLVTFRISYEYPYVILLLKLFVQLLDRRKEWIPWQVSWNTVKMTNEIDLKNEGNNEVNYTVLI